jgi:hypothetical protein
MVASNPREPLLWTPRTQEMMGGWNPREVLDHDINPNEDGDGLSHHGRETPEDSRSREQNDPKKRREQALRELDPKIPHISIKPEKIDDVLGRSPQFEQEQTMLEAGVGLDLNRNGIGLSNGMNAGSVRSEGPNVKYGLSNTLVPAMLGKAIKDGKCSNCGREVWMPDDDKQFCIMCEAGVERKESYSPIEFNEMLDQLRHSRIKGVKVHDAFCSKCNGTGEQEEYNQDRDSYECESCDGTGKNNDFGDTSNLDYFTASEDFFEQSWDSITKAKRRYKGRHYYDDEESHEEKRKSKAKNKRKKKRGKTSVTSATGGRQPGSATIRRAGNVQLDVDRGSKHQAFHPNAYSEAIRRIGSSRSERIPLRLRDPIAWERKKAYERMRRQVGSLPTGLTHHADTRGVKPRGIILGGGNKSYGTKLPTISQIATTTGKMPKGATGDPLGVHDPLFSKSMDSLSRADIMALKRKVESLMRKLEKLTKATPELGNEGKVGAPVSGQESSAPTGATKVNDEKDAWRFVDIALGQEMGLIGKK